MFGAGVAGYTRWCEHTARGGWARALEKGFREETCAETWRMTRSQLGGCSSVQRKEGEDTHLGFMISLSTVGPLELVQNDMAVDWEVQRQQRGDGKENQRLVV